MVIAVMLSVTGVMAQNGADPKGGIMSILPMLLVMFVIIYFLMIRPEQKKQKKRQEMIGSIKKGEKVLTIGGVYGTVQAMKDDKVRLKIAENTTVDLRKGAISEVINQKSETKSDKPSEIEEDKS